MAHGVTVHHEALDIWEDSARFSYRGREIRVVAARALLLAVTAPSARIRRGIEKGEKRAETQRRYRKYGGGR